MLPFNVLNIVTARARHAYLLTYLFIIGNLSFAYQVTSENWDRSPKIRIVL